MFYIMLQKRVHLFYLPTWVGYCIGKLFGKKIESMRWRRVIPVAIVASQQQVAIAVGVNSISKLVIAVGWVVGFE